MNQQQQPAADVAVGEPAAAHVVVQLAGGEMRQEGVVEHEAAGESRVGEREHANHPRPRLPEVRREEHEDGRQRADGGVEPQQRLLYRHAVGDDAQDGAADGDHCGRKRHRQAPNRAAGEGDSEQLGAVAKRFVEQIDEVHREDGGDAGGGEAGVSPVVHAPGANRLAARRRQVCDPRRRARSGF